GALLSDRTITNGTFDSNITGWSDASAGTGTISHDAGNGRLSLNGGGAGNEAKARQTLSQMGTQPYTLTFDVIGNSVTVRVGSTSGGADLHNAVVTVGAGKTVTFTRATAGDVFVEFQNPANDTRQVDNVSID